MDKKWARFFRKYRFLVGLPIDGPEHVHDKYRRMSGGTMVPWGGMVSIWQKGETYYAAVSFDAEA